MGSVVRVERQHAIRLLDASRDRLLLAAGGRLGARPRLARRLLLLIQRLPGKGVRRAVIRNVSIPLVRGMGAQLEVPVAGGSRMLVDTSDLSGRMLATSGVWEPHVTAVFRQLHSPGDVCVDVGANVGYFTLLASRLVGLDGKVHAVEPSPRTFESLLASIRLNGAANVFAVCMAAGADERRELLHDPAPRSNTGESSIRRAVAGASAARVRVRPLARLVPEEDLPRLRLVKIDVEGYEVEVLRGLEEVFERRCRPSVIVEIHADIDADAAAEIADFCERSALRMQRIVDIRSADRAWASHHAVLVDLDSKAALTSITDPRIDVLLTGALTPGSVETA